MAELLKVQNLITVSADEVSRANAAFSQVDTLVLQVSSLQVENIALKAKVKELQDKLDAVSVPVPPPVPPVPVPPQNEKKGLYVDGAKLRNRNGAELRLRCIEVMVNSNVANYGYTKFLTQLKNDIGANAVSPLFQGSYGSVAEVKKFCDAALSLNMAVGVNADHQGDTQAWICQSAIVSLLNSYPHIYLVCDVETYVDNGDSTTQAWANAEKNKITKFRNAGHIHPIKAGSHGGGRDVKYPLAKGSEVLASDPLKNVIFTFQAYWKAATGGWQYSESNGFVGGVVGTKAALAACASSGLCFIPGFDVRDDVGLTGIEDLLDQTKLLGMSCAHWAATGDGAHTDNNLYDWDFNPQPQKATATMLASKFNAAKSAFSDINL